MICCGNKRVSESLTTILTARTRLFEIVIHTRFVLCKVIYLTVTYGYIETLAYPAVHVVEFNEKGTEIRDNERRGKREGM